MKTGSGAVTTQSRRRRLLMAAGSAALAPLPALHPRRALAQAAVPRIVLVLPGNLRSMAARTDAFRQRLLELGYIEGKNLIVEIRELDGKLDQLPALLAEIVKSRPQIILVQGSQSVKAAMQATSTIPIVAFSMADPVEQGVAASLARPGGNVTGNALIETVADQKTVEILHEIVPAAKRIAMLADPTNPVYAFRQKRFPAAAGKRGLTPLLIHASRAEDLPKAFDDAVWQRAQMLVVANDAFLGTNARAIVDLAARHRIPTIYPNENYVPLGGLVAYSYSNPAMYRNAALFVDRILKGRKPADLPFEQPTRFELTINMKAAKALGLAIPQSVLLRADQVIE